MALGGSPSYFLTFIAPPSFQNPLPPGVQAMMHLTLFPSSTSLEVTPLSLRTPPPHLSHCPGSH